MALSIASNIKDDLPSSILNAWGKMPPEEQAVFEDEYTRKRRSPVMFLVLAILFPIQFFLEGRIGMGILLWVTMFMGIGLIWWIVDIFMVYGRTKAFNEEVGRTLLRDMKIMA